jgi:hypothetical protein
MEEGQEDSLVILWVLTLGLLRRCMAMFRRPCKGTGQSAAGVVLKEAVFGAQPLRHPQPSPPPGVRSDGGAVVEKEAGAWRREVAERQPNSKEQSAKLH